MEKYKRLSAKEKWEIIEPIIDRRSSVNQAAKVSGIAGSNLRTWVRKFNQDGLHGLENGKPWKQYPAELKKQAVEDVLVHGASRHAAVKKHGISSRSVLNRWIKGYNSGKGLEATSSGKVGAIMAKGRKTTFGERVEITEFTLARNKDYKSAMEKYGVSYQQVHGWVKKYEAKGADGLRDGRGRNKEPEELSETELLRLEIKKLKARNEFLEMQDAFGKKLEELERRCGRFR